MRRFLPNFGNINTRLLTFGSLLAGGTFLAAGINPDKAPYLAAAIAQLAGMGLEIFAGDWHAKIAANSRCAEDVLRNHDLARAVGDAIAVVIRKAASEPENASDRNQLEKLANVVPDRWIKLSSEFLLDYLEISEVHLPELIVQYTKGKGTSTANVLDVPAWESLLDTLARANESATFRDFYFAKGTLNRVATHLYTQFTDALREVLKHDFQGEGKAYAGLELMLLGQIISTSNDLKSTLQGQHAEIKNLLLTIQVEAVQQGATLLEKLNASEQAHHEDVIQRFTELVLGIGALARQGDANKNEVISNIRGSRDDILMRLNQLASQFPGHSETESLTVAEVYAMGSAMSQYLLLFLAAFENGSGSKSLEGNHAKAVFSDVLVIYHYALRLNLDVPTPPDTMITVEGLMEYLEQIKLQVNAYFGARSTTKLHAAYLISEWITRSKIGAYLSEDIARDVVALCHRLTIKISDAEMKKLIASPADQQLVIRRIEDEILDQHT